MVGAVGCVLGVADRIPMKTLGVEEAEEAEEERGKAGARVGVSLGMIVVTTTMTLMVAMATAKAKERDGRAKMVASMARGVASMEAKAMHPTARVGAATIATTAATITTPCMMSAEGAKGHLAEVLLEGGGSMTCLGRRMTVPSGTLAAAAAVAAFRRSEKGRAKARAMASRLTPNNLTRN